MNVMLITMTTTTDNNNDDDDDDTDNDNEGVDHLDDHSPSSRSTRPSATFGVISMVKTANLKDEKEKHFNSTVFLAIPVLLHICPQVNLINV